MNIRAETNGHKITGTLRGQIMRGELTAGVRLPSERALAGVHGVSRSTIRQALSSLEQEGLVNTRLGSGSYVNNMNFGNAVILTEEIKPLELLEMRLMLEPCVCRQAAVLASLKNQEKAEEMLNILAACGDNKSEFTSADARFNTFLAEITGNSLFIQLAQQINTIRIQSEWAHMFNEILDAPHINEQIRLYWELLAAIRSYQPERAAIIAANQLVSTKLALMRLIAG